MTCPNCSSNDIIEIDSQHYCINCGQRVAEPKITPVLTIPKLQTLPLKKPAKTPETDQSEARLRVNVLPKSKLARVPKASSDTSALHNINDKHPLPIKAASGPHTLNLKTSSSTPSASMVESSDKKGTPIPSPQPIRPQLELTPSEQVHPSTYPHSQQPQSHHPPNISHVGITPPSRIKLNSSSQASKLDADHPVKSALRVITHRFWAEIGGYAIGVSLFWVYLQLTLSQNIQIFPSPVRILDYGHTQPLVLAASVSVTVFVALTFVRAFIKGKFIYSIVKLLDRRNGTETLANRAGLSSLWSLITLDVLSSCLISGLVLTDIIAFHLIGLLPDSSGLLQPLLLTLTNIGLVYLGIGTITSRALATRTSNLAGRRASVAFSECWKLYWHYSGDIVIWGTESTLITLVIFSPFILMFSTTNFIVSSLIWLACLTLIATFCVYLAFTFNLGFWTAIYYELCSFVPQNRRSFFVGAKQPKLSSSQLSAIITLIISAIGISLSGWAYQADLTHWLVGVLKR